MIFHIILGTLEQGDLYRSSPPVPFGKGTTTKAGVPFQIPNATTGLIQHRQPTASTSQAYARQSGHGVLSHNVNRGKSGRAEALHISTTPKE